jgi:hypothetical protein
MFSARGVALKVTTVSVQLRVLHNSVYISARLKLPGTNSTHTHRFSWVIQKFISCSHLSYWAEVMLHALEQQTFLDSTYVKEGFQQIPWYTNCSFISLGSGEESVFNWSFHGQEMHRIQYSANQGKAWQISSQIRTFTLQVSDTISSVGTGFGNNSMEVTTPVILRR